MVTCRRAREPRRNKREISCFSSVTFSAVVGFPLTASRVAMRMHHASAHRRNVVFIARSTVSHTMLLVRPSVRNNPVSLE